MATKNRDSKFIDFCFPSLSFLWRRCWRFCLTRVPCAPSAGLCTKALAFFFLFQVSTVPRRGAASVPSAVPGATLRATLACIFNVPPAWPRACPSQGRIGDAWRRRACGLADGLVGVVRRGGGEAPRPRAGPAGWCCCRRRVVARRSLSGPLVARTGRPTHTSARLCGASRLPGGAQAERDQGRPEHCRSSPGQSWSGLTEPLGCSESHPLPSPPLGIDSSLRRFLPSGTRAAG